MGFICCSLAVDRMKLSECNHDPFLVKTCSRSFSRVEAFLFDRNGKTTFSLALYLTKSVQKPPIQN